jgi:hypothetical protein
LDFDSFLEDWFFSLISFLPNKPSFNGSFFSIFFSGLCTFVIWLLFFSWTDFFMFYGTIGFIISFCLTAIFYFNGSISLTFKFCLTIEFLVNIFSFKVFTFFRISNFLIKFFYLSFLIYLDFISIFWTSFFSGKGFWSECLVLIMKSYFY